jgi:hypothetical protein
MTQLSRRLGMILSVVVLCAAPTARADDIDNLGGLTQAQFKALATDLTAALAYRAISPAEPRPAAAVSGASRRAAARTTCRCRA